MSQFSILIVDDEPDKFDVIETLLSEQDYQLHYAASGQEAIASLDLVELAAGKFSITSIYKKETTVHLTLPIVSN
jgi:DNA-binding NtrC family response regulator